MWTLPTGIYLLKANNGNTKTMCEICSKIIKTRTTIDIFHTLFLCFHCCLWTNQCWLGFSSVVTIDFDHISFGWCFSFFQLWLELFWSKNSVCFRHWYTTIGGLFNDFVLNFSKFCAFLYSLLWAWVVFFSLFRNV